MSAIAELFSSQSTKRLDPANPTTVKTKQKTARNKSETKIRTPSSAPISSKAEDYDELIRMMPETKRRKASRQAKPIDILPSSAPIDVASLAIAQTTSEPKLRQTKGKSRSVIVIRPDDALSPSVSDDAFQKIIESHPPHEGVIGDIIYYWRMRQRWHRAEKSLILQGKALCRSIVQGTKEEGSALFDDAEAGKDVDSATLAALAPFLMSIEHFRKARLGVEKELASRAKKIPAYDWILSVRGIAAGGYASLIGEAGDIGSYKSVSALWKRMGLAVFEGVRQKRMTNAEDALLHGYNPSRRSVMWNIGNGIIGSMGRGKRPAPGADLDQYDWTPYERLFVERCRYECANNPEKMPLATSVKDGELRESYPKHAQARAKRYVEKRFLRDLYAKWNTA
jgi:hypothetical protein